ASEEMDTLKKLMKNGMDVARLNFSHGDYEEHRQRIERIRQAAKEVGKVVSILLDTQGPEIRTKSFQGGEAQLYKNEIVYVTVNDVVGTAERFAVSYKGLINDVEVGSTISLDDGLIQLEVLEVDKEAEEVKTRVINSGTIKNKKGVNLPNVRVNLPALTEKDRKDILFGIEEDVDF